MGAGWNESEGFYPPEKGDLLTCVNIKLVFLILLTDFSIILALICMQLKFLLNHQSNRRQIHIRLPFYHLNCGKKIV
jgi:hypothetical protein